MEMPALDEPARVRASNKAVAEFLEAARSGVVSRLQQAELENITSADAAGWTALHYCAHRDHTNALAWLLERTDNVDARTAAGFTALSVACHRGHDGCVTALLAKGAQPLTREKNGLTPLHHAAASGSAPTARALLGAGASILRAQALKTTQASTPRGIAARAAATAAGWRQRGTAEVLKLLEAESKRLHRWFRAARAFDVATLDAMLTRPESGAATALADVEDASGESALMFYCSRALDDARGQHATHPLAACKLLLHHGADPNRADAVGRTSLHVITRAVLADFPLAVHAGRASTLARVGMMSALLEAGARPLATDKEGKTPWQLVEAYGAKAAAEARQGHYVAEHLWQFPFVVALRRADGHARRMRRLRLVGRLVGKLCAWEAREAARRGL